MAGSYITELTKRRNAKRGSTPSIYDACVKALEKLGPHNFGAHDFDFTFRRHGDDVENGPAFFDYVNLSNGKAFTANIVAEIGSESEGTWMRAYPKNIPDSNLVRLNHCPCPVSSLSHFRSPLTTGQSRIG